MMEYQYLALAVILISVMYFGFKIGWFLANQTEEKSIKSEIADTLNDLYCFECEIDMPVKQKNGRLVCSNCGLPH